MYKEREPGRDDAPKNSAGLRWCVMLVALLAVFAAAIEIGARALVNRVSRIEARIAREYSEALLPPVPGRPLVLFVGNSLFLEGVRFDALKEASADRFEARRFVVESADYLDWHYGLRRLFAAGARPEAVVLMLNATQLASSRSRGEYSAFRLTRRGDVLALSADLHASPTETAAMVFGNLSMFYGLRAEVRKVVLGRLMPDLPLLTREIARNAPAPLSSAALDGIVRQRIAVLRDECAAHDARLIFAIPPGLGSYDAVLRFAGAVRSAGVPVLAPFGPGEYTRSDFSDGFHLNAAGARKYTAKLIPAAREAVTGGGAGRPDSASVAH